ncbi:hypothetical protein [Streptomyces klenkii]
MKFLSRKRYRQLLDAEAAVLKLTRTVENTRVILKAGDHLLAEKNETIAAQDRTIASTEQALKQAEEDAAEWSTAYKDQAEVLRQTREALTAASADAAVALHGELKVHVLQRGKDIVGVRRSKEASVALAHRIDNNVTADPDRWTYRPGPVADDQFRSTACTIPATKEAS